MMEHVFYQFAYCRLSPFSAYGNHARLVVFAPTYLLPPLACNILSEQVQVRKHILVESYIVWVVPPTRF
jgi:hypothetical protein